jgi:hypothetical protein
MITSLKDMLSRIEAWPYEDQEALAEAARGIAAERSAVYQASAAELALIDRGLSEARACRFADSQTLAEVRAKFRGE